MFRLPFADLKPLGKVLAPCFRLLPLILVLGLLSASLEGFSIGLVVPLLSVILGGGNPGNSSGGGNVFVKFGSIFPAESRGAVLVAGIVLLIGLKNIISYVNGVLGAWIYGRASFELRSTLARDLTNVGYPFFVDQKPGRLINILANESWRVADAILASIGMVVSAAAAFILVGFLFLLSWRMALGVAIGLLFLQLAHGFLTSRLRALSNRVSGQNSSLASRMLHLVHAGRLIRVFGREKWESTAFDSTSLAVRRAVFALERRRAVVAPAMEILQVALFLGVVVFAWKSGVAFPIIAAFLVLLYRLQPQVRGIQSALAQLKAWNGSIGEVSWLLSDQDKPLPPGGAVGFDKLHDSIAFDKLSVRYSTDALRPALDGVDFRIRAGCSTAIVGRSGAGKSTIVNLLCRFIDPTTGRLLVDGISLSTIDPVAWRSKLAVASQDLELIDGTILDNILYGRQGATASNAQDAARMADAEDFILALPNGYATAVGYRGAYLSAGQRQRIALARALIREPEILILDEATNAVDTLSEAAIVQTLRSRAGRQTTIVISHHMNTISFCDDVVVLSEGAVSAAGPLADMRQGGIADLYEQNNSGTQEDPLGSQLSRPIEVSAPGSFQENGA